MKQSDKKRKGKFFRCSCNKCHTFGGISLISICKCGVNLWQFINK